MAISNENFPGPLWFKNVKAAVILMLFLGKEQKCAWSQPVNWCVLPCTFSGKVTILNLPCCWWGIHETSAEAQRLHIKQYAAFTAPQSDWFYQSHLQPSSGGQDNYNYIRSPCWEAEWDIKTHNLKDYCPCTSPLYFLVVPPVIQLCSDHRYDSNNLDLLTCTVRGQRGKWTMSIPHQKQRCCLGGPWSDVCYPGSHVLQSMNQCQLSTLAMSHQGFLFIKL